LEADNLAATAIDLGPELKGLFDEQLRLHIKYSVKALNICFPALFLNFIRSILLLSNDWSAVPSWLLLQPNAYQTEGTQQQKLAWIV